jgi:HPt (histidine-containing phosphotransfer) domain-containing protein
MECAMSRDDSDSLAAAAHAFKSLSQNVGAIRVGNICGIIEQQASSGRLDEGFDFMPLRQAVPATIAALTLFCCPNAQGANQISAEEAS